MDEETKKQMYQRKETKIMSEWKYEHLTGEQQKEWHAHCRRLKPITDKMIHYREFNYCCHGQLIRKSVSVSKFHDFC